MRRSTIQMLALALLMIMLLSSIVHGAQLSDISANWAKDDINRLIKDGVISAIRDNTFRPDNPVTRAEFARMLAKAFHYESSVKNSFPIHRLTGPRKTSAPWQKRNHHGYPMAIPTQCQDQLRRNGQNAHKGSKLERF